MKRAVRDDAEALSLLDAELQRKPGRPVVDGDKEETGNNVTNSKRPEGNEREKALRRLRTQRPDLHQQVIDGELSAHGAMLHCKMLQKCCTRKPKPDYTTPSSINETPINTGYMWCVLVWISVL